LLGLVVAAHLVHSAHARPQACNANRAWQDRFPAWSPTGGAIAFVRQQPGCDPPAESLGIVEPGHAEEIIGSDARPGGTAPPSWSDNGLAVAFGTRRVTIGVDAPGGRVGDDGAGEYPSWGGNGIAFTIENELRVLRLPDEARRTVLVDYVKPSQSNGMPVWSPDGTRLALGVIVRGSAGGGIAVINADGSGAHVVAVGPNQTVNPTWSSDSSALAFETNRDGDFEIYSVRSDGSGLRNLSRSAQSEDRMPAWHGDTIAFISRNHASASDDYDLYTMSADGTNQRRRASDAHPYSALSWSPDGREIAFASGRECLRWGIYVLDLGSGNVRRLTNRCRFTGTPRNDVLRGTPFRDFLFGRGGNDVLTGGGGPDVIACGPGRDVVHADRLDRVARDCERVIRG
jgi:dipeptidyl aminopeptidase/acylaminoacyl peptidase